MSVSGTCGCCGKVMYEDSTWIDGAFCSQVCLTAYNENVDEYIKAKKIERITCPPPDEGPELRRRLREVYPPLPPGLIDRIMGGK